MDLSPYIMTRVSHDLAGVSGALHNTVELMQMDPAFGVEATPLLAQSTSCLLARLKFFRLLFGLPTTPVQTITAVNYLKTLTAAITLKGEVDNHFLLGAVFVCAHALIRGGEITVTPHRVRACGALQVDDDTQALLTGKKPVPSPQTVGAAWLAHYAATHNISLTLTLKGQEMTLEGVFPKPFKG